MVDLIKRRYPENIEQIRPEQTLDTGTPVINKVPLASPFQWLRVGWRDLGRAPSTLLHGLLVSVTGMMLVWATWTHPWTSVALVAGFLLIGPVLAAQLNLTARNLEQANASEPATRSTRLTEISAPLGRLTAILLGLFIVWAGYTWLWIAVLNVGQLGLPAHVGELLGAMLATPAGVVSLVGVVLIWLAFAFVAFASSSITVPAMLGQRLGLIDAVAVSLKAFRQNPVTLVLWAALITALFAVSVITGFVALIVVFPWLGLAMWHAYRDLVAVE